MPQTGSHAQLDSSELLLCPSAGSACRHQPAKPGGTWAGPWECWCAQSTEPRTAGWRAGGMELKVGSVPGDTLQSIIPSSCSQGRQLMDRWCFSPGVPGVCACLLNEEETFQSVARLSYETRIFASWQAELPSAERQLRIATKGEVIHWLQIKIFKIDLNGLVFL